MLAAEDSSATWLEADGTLPANSPLPRLLLSGAATSRLLAAGARKFTNPSNIPRPLRVADAVVTLVARHEEVTSPHVLAVLPGGDPQLRDEYVVYVAHLDGLGRGKEIGGDDIYNGAIDNALGSAILLTLGEAFGRLGERPKRSVLFFATTGEELGIVGSPYFVEHPTVPLAAIVAAINMDGPSLLTAQVRSVLAMGAANSTLGIAVDEAARQLGLDVERATAPLNYSDHYPFVMKGVPSLWIVGAGNAGEPTDATQAVQRSIHKPTDDMNRTFQWDAAVTFARLNFLIGQAVANQSDRPTWNQGNVLGEKFGKPQAR